MGMESEGAFYFTSFNTMNDFQLVRETVFCFYKIFVKFLCENEERKLNEDERPFIFLFTLKTIMRQ